MDNIEAIIQALKASGIISKDEPEDNMLSVVSLIRQALGEYLEMVESQQQRSQVTHYQKGKFTVS